VALLPFCNFFFSLDMRTIVSIPGIHCEGCKRLIEDVSKDSVGVVSATADLATKQVTVEHDDSFNFGKWKEEIEGLNPDYTVTSLAS
jgi:copper chaperone CopZ